METIATEALRLRVVSHVGDLLKQTASQRDDDEMFALIQRDHGAFHYDLNTDFPLFNGEFHADRNLSNLPQQLTALKQYYAERQLPFSWWWNAARPVDASTGAALAEAGLVSAGDFNTVVFDIPQTMAASTPLSSAFSIIRVEDDTTYQQWVDTLFDGFEELPVAIKAQFHQIYRGLGFSEVLHHYLAYQDGHPIGTVTAYFHDDMAGIYNLAVVPSQRKEGVGSQLCLAVLAAGQARGMALGCAQLMATNMAAGAMARLGAIPCGRFIPYMYLG